MKEYSEGIGFTAIFFLRYSPVPGVERVQGEFGDKLSLRAVVTTTSQPELYDIASSCMLMQMTVPDRKV